VTGDRDTGASGDRGTSMYDDGWAPPAGLIGRRWEQRIADVLRAGRLVLSARVEAARPAVDPTGNPTGESAGDPVPDGSPPFDPQVTADVLLPVFRPLYRDWFRVTVSGAENLPAEGAGIVAANHGGGLWALDSVMTTVAVHDEHPARRHLRMLGADLVFRVPGVRDVAALGGVAPAHEPDLDRLLGAGELVGVWPEGYRGIGKPFAQRYQLQRFGRGGFARAAIRHGAPIVPMAIVGAEEIHPVLGYSPTLAAVLRLPYFPLTPTFPWLGPLGLIPLPSKWLIEFGQPVPTAHLGPEAADDPKTVDAIVLRTRTSIEESIARLRSQRTSIWS
jgi:1-acyl-sn-glycerol-3-phosphate acyltransferase